MNIFRAILHFLIEQWPQALVTKNNFGTTPVETVAVKDQSKISKFKKVKQFPTRFFMILFLVALINNDCRSPSMDYSTILSPRGYFS